MKNSLKMYTSKIHWKLYDVCTFFCLGTKIRIFNKIIRPNTLSSAALFQFKNKFKVAAGNLLLINAKSMHKMYCRRTSFSPTHYLLTFLLNFIWDFPWNWIHPENMSEPSSKKLQKGKKYVVKVVPSNIGIFCCESICKLFHLIQLCVCNAWISIGCNLTSDFTPFYIGISNIQSFCLKHQFTMFWCSLTTFLASFESTKNVWNWLNQNGKRTKFVNKSK